MRIALHRYDQKSFDYRSAMLRSEVEEESGMIGWIGTYLDSEPSVLEAIVAAALCLAFVLWMRGPG